jgi:hypothetical protein
VVRDRLEADLRHGPAATLHKDFMADLPVAASQAVTRVEGPAGTVAVISESESAACDRADEFRVGWGTLREREPELPAKEEDQ